MKYLNMKLTKKLVSERYEVVKRGKFIVSCDAPNKDFAINEAMINAVGMDCTEDVLIYRVSVTRWFDENNRMIREHQSTELAVRVFGRKVKGTGGWIDYEE